MWLSIRLPQLPLEALLTEQHSTHAQTVIHNNRIIAINPIAQQQGIKINQSLSSVYALSENIQILERNFAQEQQTLNNLAMLVYSYSPSVSIDGEQLLLLEIARSLRLFNGLNNLLQQLQKDLNQQQLSYRLAIGNTPKSAAMLSLLPLQTSLDCWDKPIQKINRTREHEVLNQLSVDALAVAAKIIQKIHSVGIRQIIELRKLPLSSIRKRFGEELTRYLSALYGEIPDLQRYFIPAESFAQYVEFIDVIHHRQGLLFPIKRMIQQLCRFLTLQQKSCQHLHWTLYDSEKNSIGFDVLLTDNQINESVYLELTRLNLERYTLHAPIEAIALKAHQLTDLNLHNQTLFEQAQAFKQTPVFINKIQAKLGQDNCYQLSHQTEHIPELASAPMSTSHALKQVSQISQATQAPQNLQAYRPSWLLEKPQPVQFNQHKLLWQGELKIISSAERMTTHWWNQKIARDYFVAEHDNGSLYWVFYDKLQQQWYIQGVYG